MLVKSRSTDRLYEAQFIDDVVFVRLWGDNTTVRMTFRDFDREFTESFVSMKKEPEVFTTPSPDAGE